jgi:hypothetical protein
MQEIRYQCAHSTFDLCRVSLRHVLLYAAL